ncbi:MAG: hypothetical protein GF384_02065 [Elusimicrobia bacterium]|nr:hypothetical protein [Elusimicrobiota bacterium]MBD3411771.1 hypothetical protein [Elusimicrobiota bacterium]
MKDFFCFFYSVFCILGLLAGCGERDSVIASIGRKQITEKEFQEQMENSPAQYEGYLGTHAGKRKYLEALINEHLIVMAAEAEGLHRHDEIRQALKEFRTDYWRQFREFRDKLLIKKFIDTRRDTELAVSAEEIADYCDEHARDFKNPRQVIISHILLETRAQAEDVLRQLEKGSKFEDLVTRYSQDRTTRDQGGTLPPLTQGDMLPEFEAVVFDLTVGDISGIVKSDFGYHIIRKDNEQSMPALSREEINERIRKILEKEKFIDLLEKYRERFAVRVNNNYFSEGE